MKKKLTGHKQNKLTDIYSELTEYSKSIEDIDQYGAGPFLNDFEQHMAKRVGMESALFLPSGVMAQLIAVKIYADEAHNNEFACHESCHLIRHEEEAYKYLIGCQAKLVGTKDKVPLVEDLKPGVSSLVYEIPMRHLGGDAPSWEELEKIKSYCQDNKVKLHIDGARIFEMESYYQRSVQEIIQDCDSLFISFYKGFGSTSGSMLFGSEEFITKARVWLRRFGGNLFQLYPLAIPAKMNFDKRIDKFPQWVERAKEIGKILHEDLEIQVYPYPVKTNMMHLSIPKLPENLNQIFKDFNDADIRLGIWEESPKGHSRCEFTVAEATCELSLEEIRSYFKHMIS